MAQEIMVAGAIYEGVPSVRLPDSHGVFHPFTDTSDTTAVAADVAQGKTFHLADGSAATGTAAGATLVTKSITANGTYSAEDDDADGYSEVTVNVSGGGGGGGVEPKNVNFIDYDGTIVHSYTAAEFAALTAMPENPTHDGLVAQGWNWSLADAQSYVAGHGFLTIGQMYATASGDTEIDIELYEGRLSPYIRFAVSGAVEIDWGDGTAKETVTGTSLLSGKNTPHEYAAAGRYTIVVHVVRGSMALYAASGSPLLNKGVSSTYENRVYSNCVQAVRVGDGVTIKSYAFNGCSSMSYVTLPSSVTGIDGYAFQTCASLRTVTIPSGVQTIPTYAFNGCGSLSAVAVPNSVSQIASYAFQNCTSLSKIHIPVDVSVLDMSSFYYCSSLATIDLPDGITNISNNTFSDCSSLVTITIPAAVTRLNNNAFQSCRGLAEVHFRGTTPPTLQSASAFSNLPTDCKIYVPAGSLSAYTSASNYPSSSTYTYVEE